MFVGTLVGISLRKMILITVDVTSFDTSTCHIGPTSEKENMFAFVVIKE